MALFTELDAQAEILRALLGDEVEPAELVPHAEGLDDTQAIDAITAATALIQCGERIRAAITGVVSARSSRTAGQAGLAQSLGHRNAVSLVQEITGSTRAEAARQVRVGESLLASTAESSNAATDRTPSDEDGPRTDPAGPWHSGLDDALLDGRLTTAQHDAIRQGLAGPPVAEKVAGDSDGLEHDALMRELWSVAADQLLAAAAHDTPEMLAAGARAIRDSLDPEGAARRFQDRYAQRAFRVWTTTTDADAGRSTSMTKATRGPPRSSPTPCVLAPEDLGSSIRKRAPAHRR